MCNKITHGSTRDNGGNTRENNGNRRDKLYQLKLNDIDCHDNCHIGFSEQVSAQISILVLHLKFRGQNEVHGHSLGRNTRITRGILSLFYKKINK